MSDEAVKVAVWDLPIRLFHWTLAALLAFSFYAVKSGHIDWHIYSGLAISSLLIFRLLWGLFGSSTARFANFVRGPRGVLSYLRDRPRWTNAGHTPLGALSIIAMLGALIVQVALGMFAVDEDGLNEGPLARFISVDGADRMRDYHGLWFWMIVALVVMHLGAIFYYRLVRKQKLTKSMITGTQSLPPGTAPMRRGEWWVAVLCMIAGIAITRWIIAGVPPFGT